MIFEETLESLENIPMHIESAFADISYVKAMNSVNQDLVNSVSFTLKGHVLLNGKRATQEEVEKIKKAFLKLMVAEKKIEIIFKSLTIRLEENVKDYDNEINMFKEACAIAGMSLRSKELTKALDTEKNIFCSCRASDDGKMIACDNKECAIEWFHLKCVGLTKVPKGSWLCKKCLKNK